MSNRKKKSSDRHKPSTQVRLNIRLAEQLEKLAERNATSVTQEANRAVRLLLEEAGLWPPAETGPADKPAKR
ncbi:MAG TPA: hypothetical protein VMG10_30975 [Gemmataceae bacterium]|nr:hypothetical protein [Gemmataceae bacterium]